MSKSQGCWTSVPQMGTDPKEPFQTNRGKGITLSVLTEEDMTVLKQREVMTSMQAIPGEQERAVGPRSQDCTYLSTRSLTPCSDWCLRYIQTIFTRNEKLMKIQKFKENQKSEFLHNIYTQHHITLKNKQTKQSSSQPARRGTNCCSSKASVNDT